MTIKAAQKRDAEAREVIKNLMMEYLAARKRFREGQESGVARVVICTLAFEKREALRRLVDHGINRQEAILFANSVEAGNMTEREFGETAHKYLAEQEGEQR